MTDRQKMGCAYERPTADNGRAFVLRAPPLPWTPSVCPLYLGRLPGIAEIQAAHPHWIKGTLAAWLDGDEPTRPLLDAIVAYDHGIQEFTHDPNRKGGA